jgi:hypothetical protein
MNRNGHPGAEQQAVRPMDRLGAGSWELGADADPALAAAFVYFD